MVTNRFLRLNRLRITRRGHTAYDQFFHDGVNIIRGQNGSGKSTIADFIFFILGGEFDDWKDAASQCDEVQAEIETPRGKLTLKRQIDKKLEPMFVFYGPLVDAAEHALEGWERFPIRRQGVNVSFSQVLFRSLHIPEAQSEGASNITMHQLLRLAYSDQRTPAARLFRYEDFDTQTIREAVGDLVCGISGYEIYEIGLKLRDLQKSLDAVEMRLSGLSRALPSGTALHTPELIQFAIRDFHAEKEKLASEIAGVDDLIEPGQVKEYLDARRTAQASILKQRRHIKTLEVSINMLEFELREIGEFLEFLAELTEKLVFTEATFSAVGSIEFTHCPACGSEIGADALPGHCVVCKSPDDPEAEKSRYNQIRLDLEIQTRESQQLIRQKHVELDKSKQEIRRLRRTHEKDLTDFDLKYAGVGGPREAFIVERSNRLGHIDAEIDYLLQSMEIAEEIEKLTDQKTSLQNQIEEFRQRNEGLRRNAGKRRGLALTQVSDIGASILRDDFPRQSEFIEAKGMSINFQNDAIAVDSRVNFAESSNVFLKNTAILSLFLAAGRDPQFFHPHFLLLDSIEDKGMEEERSHLFQRLIVERATELETPYQIIFTTSMMNPDLELDEYVIGPRYTSDLRTLDLGY